MSSKARRPYLMGKESVGDFYKADVRFLKEIVGRESEFEKPYLDEEYRKMHFDFPWPDWPPFPDFPPFPGIPPGPIPGLSLCGIICYTPLSDCEEPIWCHPGLWCGYDPACYLCSWIVEGATTGYTWKKIVAGVPDKFWGIEIWIDKNLLVDGEALIHVQMKDPCGNLCGEDLEVTCRVCPPEVVMTWASGDLTVGQSSSVEVLVANGVGPYSWSVAGTGFSMLHASTDGVSNTLVTDASACGSATITVTDFCEDSVVGYVRCTAGQWTLKGTCYSCFSGGSVWNSYCATCGEIEEEHIAGNKRWLVIQRYEFYPSNRTAIWGVSGCASACSFPNPPCGDPITCGDGTPCTSLYSCYSPSFKYHEWECIP